MPVVANINLLAPNGQDRARPETSRHTRLASRSLSFPELMNFEVQMRPVQTRANKKQDDRSIAVSGHFGAKTG